MKRRKTPYVNAQTITLMLIQVIPLFLLPFVLLPFLGNNGWFDSGTGKYLADHLFPAVKYGHGREYWRAVGFILAWPLFIWNVFTSQPMWWWLTISFVQTFVIIPLMIWRWGKGAYCGWICSCGALSETMGDTQRDKMPHGPFWNRMNMVGQVVLACCSGSAGRSNRLVGLAKIGNCCDREKHLPGTAEQLVGAGNSTQLLPCGGYFSGRDCWTWHVFLVQWTCVVPICLSASSTNARLRTILQISNIRRKEEMYFLQRMYFCLSSGNRYHEFCEQGNGDGRSGMRALFGVCADVSNGYPDFRSNWKRWESNFRSYRLPRMVQIRELSKKYPQRHR